MELMVEEKDLLDEITQKIIGCAYEVSNTLGSGFLEGIYEKALQHQIQKMGLSAERQYQLKVVYDNILVGEFFADMVVEKKVLVELKAVRMLDEIHVAQAMNYLKASGMRCAYSLILADRRSRSAGLFLMMFGKRESHVRYRVNPVSFFQSLSSLPSVVHD